MYKLIKTPQFERDVKTCKKKHWDIDALKNAMLALSQSNEKALHPNLKDHSLVGARRGFRAIHIHGSINPPSNKWILIYKIKGDSLVFVRTGDHSIYKAAL